MAELGEITIACELTTPNNIAMLKQLTETLVVVENIRTKNAANCGQSAYDELLHSVVNAMRLLLTFNREIND